MEWLIKLLGDLDEDDRRRFLAVLHAELSFGDADQQACVHVLDEEVAQWARLETRELVVLRRFTQPQRRDFVDPRWYAGEVWLSEGGSKAVLALVAGALQHLDVVASAILTADEADGQSER